LRRRARKRCGRLQAMLELRPNCECCDRDLPPDSAEAVICTYECTFCAECATTEFGGVCPNCGGDFPPPPVPPANKLAKDAGSTKRVLRAAPCGARSA